MLEVRHFVTQVDLEEWKASSMLSENDTVKHSHWVPSSSGAETDLTAKEPTRAEEDDFEFAKERSARCRPKSTLTRRRSWTICQPRCHGCHHKFNHGVVDKKSADSSEPLLFKHVFVEELLQSTIPAWRPTPGKMAQPSGFPTRLIRLSTSCAKPVCPVQFNSQCRLQHGTIFRPSGSKRSPCQAFSGSRVRSDPDGRSVRVLGSASQNHTGIKGKWKHRSRATAHFPSHVAAIALVPSSQTGRASLPFPVQFDPTLQTVKASFRGRSPESKWQHICGFTTQSVAKPEGANSKVPEWVPETATTEFPGGHAPAPGETFCFKAMGPRPSTASIRHTSGRRKTVVSALRKAPVGHRICVNTMRRIFLNSSWRQPQQMQSSALALSSLHPHHVVVHLLNRCTCQRANQRVLWHSSASSQRKTLPFKTVHFPPEGDTLLQAMFRFAAILHTQTLPRVSQECDATSPRSSNFHASTVETRDTGHVRTSSTPSATRGSNSRCSSTF